MHSRAENHTQDKPHVTKKRKKDKRIKFKNLRFVKKIKWRKRRKNYTIAIVVSVVAVREYLLAFFLFLFNLLLLSASLFALPLLGFHCFFLLRCNKKEEEEEGVSEAERVGTKGLVHFLQL